MYEISRDAQKSMDDLSQAESTRPVPLKMTDDLPTESEGRATLKLTSSSLRTIKRQLTEETTMDDSFSTAGSPDISFGIKTTRGLTDDSNEASGLGQRGGDSLLISPRGGKGVPEPMCPPSVDTKLATKSATTGASNPLPDTDVPRGAAAPTQEVATDTTPPSEHGEHSSMDLVPPLPSDRKHATQLTVDGTDSVASSPSDARAGFRKRSGSISKLRSGLWSKIKQKSGEQEDQTFKENAKVASYYVEDAINGRLSNGKAVMYLRSNEAPLVYKAFNFRESEGWSNTVLGANLLHSFLVVMEPAYNSDRCQGVGWSLVPWWVVMLLELVCVAIYVVDIGAKMYYQTPKVYITKTQQVVHLSIVCILAMDAVLPISFLLLLLPSPLIVSPGLASRVMECGWSLRLTRPLRPLVLLVRVRSVRRFYTVVIEMLPNLMAVTVPIIFLLVLSAVVLGRLLGHGMGEMSNFPTALFQCFVLLFTMDNYTVLLEGAIEFHPVAALLIFAFIIVGVLFLISLLLGVTVDAYTEYTREQMKSERKKMLRGLAKAFSTLDTDKMGWMTTKAWKALLTHLKPGTDAGYATELYRLLSGGLDAKLDAVDFLRMEEVLRAERAVPEGTEHSYLPSRSGWSEGCVSIRNSKAWLYVTRGLIGVDIAMLCGGAENSVALGGVGFNEWILGLFLVEQGVKVGATGSLKAYWHFASFLHRMEVLLLVLGMVLWAAHVIVPETDSETVDETAAGTASAAAAAAAAATTAATHQLSLATKIVRARTVANGLRVLRAVLTSESLCKFAIAVTGIMPLLWQTSGFAFVIIYFFALLGLEVMGGEVAAFSTVSASFLVLVQLMFSVALGDVLTETLAQAKGVHCGFIFAFFIAYFCLGVMILINLVTALTMEFYNRQFSDETMSHCMPPHPDVTMEQERVKVENRKAASVMDRLRHKLTRSTSMNVRDLMVDTNKMVTRKEVQACGKEATVDLLKIFDEKAKKAAAAQSAKEEAEKSKKEKKKEDLKMKQALKEAEETKTLKTA